MTHDPDLASSIHGAMPTFHTHAAKRLFAGDAVAQRLKSTLLLPVGTVASVFDVSDAIALTFDDGPDPDVTPLVLDVLARHEAKATFFVLTDQALAHPGLMRRILDEGHEIGLHFDRHDRIPDLAAGEAWRRMRSARRALGQIVGRTSLFRPPYGSQTYLTYLFARLIGLQVIGWSQVANDWLEQSAETSARSASEHLKGGDIVLLHDGLALSPGQPRPNLDRSRVADLVLQEAERRHLRPLTVGALLARGVPRRSHWFR